MRMLEAFKWMEDNPLKIMVDCNGDSHRFNSDEFQLKDSEVELWGTNIDDLNDLYNLEYTIPAGQEKDQFDIDFEPLVEVLTEGLKIMKELLAKGKK